MSKTLWVAWREFTTTVMTRAFIIAVVLPPLVMTVAFTLLPILMNQAAPKVAGRISVLDKSGAVSQRLTNAFTPEHMQARHGQKVKDQVKKAPAMPGVDPSKAAEQAGALTQTRTQLALEVVPRDADVDAAKKEMAQVNAKEAGSGNPRLVLAVIPADAVVASGDGTFAGFDLFVAPKLDPEVQGDIQDQISRAIVDARLENNHLDVGRVRALLEWPQAAAKTVTATGETKTNEFAAMMVPGAFLFLLWVCVFSAGQYLLTTTIEEKGNRVMEVLLSAVSPFQLMIGKILGQMTVGMVMMVAYAGVGVAGLVLASLTHLVEPMNLVYLVVYFFIAFFMIASLMASIGSAVNDLREAQSLMAPIMIVLIIPMMLWFPILRNPNSIFAQVVSFVPPISPFVMVLRLSGSEPIPIWQIPASMIAGVVYAIAFAWGASKIFRIGVLMYGKPPNLPTLIKWIRMA
jgi:ABC-2 type transport system permease protein